MKKAISEPSYQAFLTWLYESRLERNLSMRALGELIGEPHSVVQKIEDGERRLDLYEYVQYCKALNIKPEAGLKILK